MFTVLYIRLLGWVYIDSTECKGSQIVVETSIFILFNSININKLLTSYNQLQLILNKSLYLIYSFLNFNTQDEKHKNLL